jgi:hypothetical protein
MEDYKLSHYLNETYKIGFVIFSPIIGAIDFILNLICFIVFLRFKEKIFFYLAIKSLAESLYLLNGAISPNLTCEDCKLENTYFRAISFN